MRPSAPDSRGLAVLAVLPWLIAGIGFVLAAWLGSGSAPPPISVGETADPAELKAIRMALATETAENTALRAELDRLVRQTGGGAPGPRATPGAAGDGAGAPFPDEKNRELSARISEALSRAAVGDQASARDGAMAMLQALQGGPEAMQALRQAYLDTGDPKARMMMLPTMLFGGGEEARDFIVAQAQGETDPELRAALLKQASGLATPKYAEELKDSFLESLASDTDPELRSAAIRGLRYAKGKDVQEALLASISDPSEEIRLAAIENLASRPELRERLRETLSQDPSSHVREVGECRLLLAEQGSAR